MVFTPLTAYGGATSPSPHFVTGVLPYDTRSVRAAIHHLGGSVLSSGTTDPAMAARGMQANLRIQQKSISKMMKELTTPHVVASGPVFLRSHFEDHGDSGSDMTSTSDSESVRTRRSTTSRSRKRHSMPGNGATVTFEGGSPNTTIYNIEHVEHGTFKGPTSSPANNAERTVLLPQYHSAIAIPPIYLVRNTPPPSYVNLGRPDDLKQSDPWSANYKQPVIDVSTLLSARRDINIQINPIISSSTRPFKLLADLRVSFDSIFVRGKGDSNGSSLWDDHEQPATLPKLNSMTLISPLLEGELTVSNVNGVTCGDVLRSLYNYAQSEVSKKTWSSLDNKAKAAIIDAHEYHRPPHVKHSVLPKRTTTNCDVFYDKTCFTGLRRDEEYIARRIGWNNPVCFVMDLDRQHFGWKEATR